MPIMILERISNMRNSAQSNYLKVKNSSRRISKQEIDHEPSAQDLECQKLPINQFRQRKGRKTARFFDIDLP
jgi:hypothetical protein